MHAGAHDHRAHGHRAHDHSAHDHSAHVRRRSRAAEYSESGKTISIFFSKGPEPNGPRNCRKRKMVSEANLYVLPAFHPGSDPVDCTHSADFLYVTFYSAPRGMASGGATAMPRIVVTGRDHHDRAARPS